MIGSKKGNMNIKGYPGTAAQQYAKDNDFRFISPDEMVMIGDVDDDAEVTIFDATCIQRYPVSLPTESFNENAAVTDHDKNIAILDATRIRRRLVAPPTQAPGIKDVGEPLT